MLIARLMKETRMHVYIIALYSLLLSHRNSFDSLMLYQCFVRDISFNILHGDSNRFDPAVNRPCRATDIVTGFSFLSVCLFSHTNKLKTHLASVVCALIPAFNVGLFLDSETPALTQVMCLTR